MTASFPADPGPGAIQLVNAEATARAAADSALAAAIGGLPLPTVVEATFEGDVQHGDPIAFSDPDLPANVAMLSALMLADASWDAGDAPSGIGFSFANDAQPSFTTQGTNIPLSGGGASSPARGVDPTISMYAPGPWGPPSAGTLTILDLGTFEPSTATVHLRLLLRLFLVAIPAAPTP